MLVLVVCVSDVAVLLLLVLEVLRLVVLDVVLLKLVVAVVVLVVCVSDVTVLLPVVLEVPLVEPQIAPDICGMVEEHLKRASVPCGKNVLGLAGWFGAMYTT